MLLDLPIELLYEIVHQINNGNSLFNTALSCKLLASIVLDSSIYMKQKLRRKICKERDESIHITYIDDIDDLNDEQINDEQISKTHIYYKLPNGWLTGEYKILSLNGQLREQ